MTRRRRNLDARLDAIGDEFLALVERQGDLTDKLSPLCESAVGVDGIDGARILAGYLRHVREARVRAEAEPTTLSVWLKFVADLESIPGGSLWARMAWKARHR
jgi:hypothetical protein